MAEVYTVLLRSTDGLGADNRSLSFTVNWEGLLPKKYKRFVAKGLFRGRDSPLNTEDSVLIYVDCFNSSIFDSKTQGKSFVLSNAWQFAGQTDNVYQNLANDIEGLLVEYPSQNYITVSVKQYNGNDLATAPSDWLLWIQLYPVVTE